MGWFRVCVPLNRPDGAGRLQLARLYLQGDRGPVQSRSNDSERRLFGVNVSEHLAMCCGGQGHIPLVVSKCIEALERRNAYDVVGLYRVSASTACMQVWLGMPVKGGPVCHY